MPTNQKFVSFSEVPGFNAMHVLLTTIVDDIVQEIIDKMTDTLAEQGKAFSDGALDEWKPKLANAVWLRLLLGGNWANEKDNVLAAARDMALIAAILSGNSPTVVKARAHAAFRAVKDDANCPGDVGSGRWCDFDI
jgi:hypothetical protein